MAMPDPFDLPDIISEIRGAYHIAGHNDWDIGNGLCENFAFEVLNRWVGPDWPEIEGEADWWSLDTGSLLADECWDWALLDRVYGIRPPEGVDPETLKKVARIGPGHVWIYASGRHYDAESPMGVSSFFELNFFRRWIGQLDDAPGKPRAI